jgi:glutamyl-tRNA synthetase
MIRKYTLANAIKYDGKANAKAVIGKLFAERPDLRDQAHELMDHIRRMIDEVNALTLEEQTEELRAINPDLLEDQHEHRKKELPPLEGAQQGQVVTRLPPEPSGYPHIGHGYAGYINWYYARKYDGRLILRFEDTNPRSVQEEYYEAFREGYQWLGIDWDEERKVSDDIPYFYDKAHQLLERGKAYMCLCENDVIKENRRKSKECIHRNQSPGENLAIWEDVLAKKYGEGEVVCRLKIDMTHANAVMRDPNIFRIIDYPHPFQKRKYYFWPTYDFAVAFEDHMNGITHILRSSEFASRGELQTHIRDLFNLPQPRIQEWSRFTIEGTPVGKRLIRPLIKSGKIHGWDDIRLSTLTGLRRRGIIPETIKEVTREVGLSIAQPVIDWALILGINRRIIDPIANRYYFVSQPVLVEIKDTKPQEATIPFHPDFKDRGSRTISVKSRVYIDGSDADSLELGEIFRLKHLYNVRVEKQTKKRIECRYVGNALDQADKKIQWVSEETVPVQLFTPDVLFINGEVNPQSLKAENGLGEKALQLTQLGELIQLERKGFGRIDQIQETVIINMTG